MFKISRSLLSLILFFLMGGSVISARASTTWVFFTTQGKGNLVNLYRYNTATGLVLRVMSSINKDWDVSPDCSLLAYTGPSGQQEHLTIRNLKSGKELFMGQNTTPPTRLSFSPNAHFVSLVYLDGSTNRLEAFDITNGSELPIISWESGIHVVAIRWSQDEKSLAIAAQDSENPTYYQVSVDRSSLDEISEATFNNLWHEIDGDNFKIIGYRPTSTAVCFSN